ncbi:MAG TPA: glycosyl hydrolase family 18 protein [Bacillota bacterium]
MRSRSFHGRLLAAWLAALLLLTVSTGCARLGCSPAKKPLGGGASGRLEVMAFYENGDTSGTSGAQGPGDNEQTFVDSFPALKDNAASIDIVTPFWFSVGGDGSVTTAKPVSEVQDFAKKNKVQVWALVNNAKPGDQVAGAVLTDPTARANAIKNIEGIADKYGYDGIFIDFQLIPPKSGPQLTAMVRQLAKDLHAKKKKLGVALFPKIDVSPDVSGAYDYAALGKEADAVLLMAYDRHYESSPPGPVSPLPWVETNLKSTLKSVPAKKVLLAIGTYGYDWPAGGNGEYLATRVALNRAKANGATVKRDSASGQPYFTYTKDGLAHEVWFQDAEAFRQRAALAKKYKLRGVGVWRLGFEEPGFWKVIAEAIGAAKK